MSDNLSICIENCHPEHEGARTLRCCVLNGLAPGLSLAPDGTIAWKTDAPAACRLVVSRDQRLVCLREAGAPGRVTVLRDGRSTTAPEGKPVVLLDQDELVVGGARLRLHVHGWTRQEFAPSYLPVDAPGAGRLSRVAAAGMVAALGLTSLTGCWASGSSKPVEIRHRPPVDDSVREDPAPESPKEADAKTPDEPAGK
ncbi:MAG: hypothetical protein CVU65_07825 [Deltaproteobacteria bacterium HGW-Deltaproteobacteria-22]|jgi:hypothetical protein|nr:MAG: hypothetical protein CVU65_07825 [Deltaproteobacteria bacterium HGW-Deltaproteobacteria-22]